MSNFETRTLYWQGKPYAIPANKVFGAIEIAERHATRTQLVETLVMETMPYTKLAQVWAAVLRYAGATVTAEEAYLALCERDPALAVLDQPYVGACLAVLMVMLTRKQMDDLLAQLEKLLAGDPPGDDAAAAAGKSKPTAAHSAATRSSSLSANGALLRANSGA
jgi:hypothetical protein